jgi:hypothetical protein
MTSQLQYWDWFLIKFLSKQEITSFQSFSSTLGQFRETQMCDVAITDALEQAQKLAAHTKAFISLHETNVVTNGEVIVEISNNQLGMGNLHSTLQVCGSVAAAVLGCVKLCADADEEGKKIGLLNKFYYYISQTCLYEYYL